MARKSRKKYHSQGVGSGGADAVVGEITKETEKIYHAALYARLSLESEANRDRNTIETQMQLLHSFVDGTKDIVAEKEYFDISQTGTDFDRPGFDEMIQDMRIGRIDCVIVKDLSRLGRNYVETGNYIERIFPFFNVRFIAVTDGYDSTKEDVNLMVCLSNIFNEYYSRDLAKKIKASARANWKEGKCVAGSVSYGLMKDPDDKHRLIPDPETAPVVREIFDWFLSGKTYAQISNMLEERGIVNPGAYKIRKKKGAIPDGTNCKWGNTTIRRILMNRYLAGDSVHNQYTNDSFAERKMVSNPESEWIIVEDTHEAVVPRDIFNRAQEEMTRRSEVPVKNPGLYKAADLNLFRGKIRCADCGFTMYLNTHNGGKTVRYVCGTYMKGGGRCTSHLVDGNKVYDETLRVIHAHMNVYVDTVEMIRRLNSRQKTMERYDVVSKEIRRLRNDIKKLNTKRSQLYEDYTLKLIDEEQYDEIREKDARREKQLKEKLNHMLSVQAANDRNFHTDKEWEGIIEKYRNKRRLTKDMVDAFVEAIYVHVNGFLEIKLRYEDTLKELVDFAKTREAEDD